MTTSGPRQKAPLLAKRATVSDRELTVELSDGSKLSVPLEWYPRLLNGRPKERANWELIGEGDGIHWPDLDEDLSVEGLIEGRRSGESDRSFQKWLAGRQKP